MAMAQAIDIAEKGRFTCSPNPCVGCVVVRDENEIGRGFHQYTGQRHAEVNGIANARSNGHDIADSTVYVVLEARSWVRLPPAQWL